MPWLPLTKLAGGNARGHWAAREAARVTYRESCYHAAYEARHAYERVGVRFPLPEPVEMSVTFVMPDKAGRDLDGMVSRFKYGVDAIVSSGILAGDDWHRISELHVRATVGRKTEAGAIVQLRAVEGAS